VLAEYAPDDILPHITRDETRREYPGSDGRLWSVRMNSLRYWTFRRSLACAVCGVRGTIMSLERGAGSSGSPHFNLYAALPDGSRVLMTKDHIVPKSAGGEDADGNFQTMCTVCNNLKSNYSLCVAKVRRLRAALDAGGTRQTLDRMARRMAEDDGSPPMTAKELAEVLMRHPDDAVAIDTGGEGMEPLRTARRTPKGPLDSNSLPDIFIVMDTNRGGISAAAGDQADSRARVVWRDILCKPCYDAISTAVLASDLTEGTGIEDISIESAMKFAADFRYACKHSADYASHRCMGGDCRCVCHAFR